MAPERIQISSKFQTTSFFDQKNRKQGEAIGFYIRDGINYKIVDEKISKQLEYQIIKITINNIVYHIFNVYIPKKEYGKTALIELSHIISQSNCENKIVMGDFNTDPLICKELALLNTFASEAQLYLHSNLSTRVSRNSSSYIDLFF